MKNKHRKQQRNAWKAHCMRSGYWYPRPRARAIITIRSNIPDAQLEAFRKHWFAMISGVENAVWSPVYAEPRPRSGRPWIRLDHLTKMPRRR